MSELLVITDKLKELLKTKQKTYKDIANLLHLSESSVKRMFSNSSFSLQRLELICNFLGIAITDLIILIERNSKKKDSISLALEQKLVSETPLLLITNCVLNHWKFADLRKTYNFSETELIVYLAELERMGILQLLPSNKIKLLVSSNFKWQVNGPIEVFFQNQVQNKFFQSNFDRPGENRIVNNGMLAKSSHAYINEKMQSLSDEFERLCLQDAKLDIEQRFGMTLVQAIRPWELDVFSEYRRSNRTKSF